MQFRNFVLFLIFINLQTPNSRVVEKVRLTKLCFKEKYSLLRITFVVFQVKTERRTLGDHFPVIEAARVNLARFIKYKQKGH